VYEHVDVIEEARRADLLPISAKLIFIQLFQFLTSKPIPFTRDGSQVQSLLRPPFQAAELKLVKGEPFGGMVRALPPAPQEASSRSIFFVRRPSVRVGIDCLPAYAVIYVCNDIIRYRASLGSVGPPVSSPQDPSAPPPPRRIYVASGPVEQRSSWIDRAVWVVCLLIALLAAAIVLS
jgi:hypothetical protein